MKNTILHRSLAATLAMVTAASGTVSTADAAPRTAAKVRAVKARVGQLPIGTQRPTSEIPLSTGQGQLVTLPASVANVWTSNPAAADVYVNSPRQIYIFGKGEGEGTIFATTAGGQVVYATNVRVSQNITSVDRVLKLAMPDSAITVTTAGQVAVLSGTVATPDDAAQAEAIVRGYLNPGLDVSDPKTALKIVPINRLRTATPLQVNLQVKIAEVSRELVKEIGNNVLTRDTTGGFQFNLAQGRNFSNGISYRPTTGLQTVPVNIPGVGTVNLPYDPATNQIIRQGATIADLSRLGQGAGKTSLSFFGKLFGVDVLSALDLAENDGLVTTLAQPNLTAISGETASFLAGGEFPIPISQSLGAVSIEYKQYGVSLAFTPVVLSDGRISMRVRPEVSELSSTGAVVLNGYSVPAITTRRAETTVELGSGQSFMIGGLLRNVHSNSIDKAPGLGDVPILGAMFRSSRFRRSETELMIIVTPYLVKPVSSPSAIKLPTDGYKASTDLERVLLGQSYSGKSGMERPVPTMAPPTTVAPGGNVVAPKAASGAAAPGFSQ